MRMTKIYNKPRAFNCCQITMQLWLTVILIILSTPSFSQTSVFIDGIVYDKDSKTPIAFATVAIVGKSIGTVTNNDGQFGMTLNEVDIHDTIQVGYLGYNTYKQSVLAFVEMKQKAIELEKKYFSIAEVTIRPKKFNIKRFMEKTIIEYNRTRRTNPHIALSHYREKARSENRYVAFRESIGYSAYMGEAYLLEGNWNIFHYLSNYWFFYDNTRTSSQAPEWTQSFSSNPVASVPLHGSVPLHSFRFFEIYGPLNTRDIQFSLVPQYRYILDSTYYINHQLVYRVSFSPTGFNRNNSVNGFMDIFEEDHRIYKVECRSPVTARSLNNHDFIEGMMIFELQYYKEQPYLAYAHVEYEISGYSHTTEFRVLIQKYDEFRVTDDEYASLFSQWWFPYITYDKEQWRTYNIQYPPDIDKINNDLKLIDGQELEEQFIDNSDQWYHNEPVGISMVHASNARIFINNLKKLF